VNREILEQAKGELTEQRDRIQAAVDALQWCLDGSASPLPECPVVEVEQDRGGCEPEVTPAQKKGRPAKTWPSAGSVAGRAIEALQKAGRPMSSDELAGIVNHPAGKLHGCLGVWVERGLLRREGPSVWALSGRIHSGGNGLDEDEPRFSALHLPGPREGGGYVCSRCGEEHDDIDDFGELCPIGTGSRF